MKNKMTCYREKYVEKGILEHQVNFEKYYGCLLRYIRKNNGLSLENAAHDLKIPKSTLGEYERGIRIQNFELFESFITFYSIDFSFDSEHFEDASSRLDRGISAYIYNNP